MRLVAFGDKNLVGGKNAPYHLANKLGYEFQDMTTSTSGPQSVFRLVTKYISQNENIFPVIGWNNVHSVELRRIYKKFPVDGFMDKNYFTFHKRQKNLEIEFQRLIRFEHILTDEYLTNIRWCSIVYSLQEFLKSLDINYLMYNIETSIEWNSYTLYMIKNIDRTKYIGVENPKANIRKYVKKLKQNFDTVDGQKLIAKLLSERIEK